MENREAARSIFAVASLLESQGANPYRVRAYRRAAVNLLRLPVAASALVKEPETPEGPPDPPPSGAPAKRKPKRTNASELAVPWLGDRLRLKLAELVTTGQMQFHQDFLQELPKPLRELLAVPGIGPKTAQRLIDELGVRSPRGVIGQARKGRIQRLHGFGPTREAQLAAAAQ
jgi:DNA polymerase (family 10)